MRFMVLVKATKDSETGVPPSTELLDEMGKYNEELAKAGVLLDLNGLQPTSKGARVKFSNGKATVIDGPYTEAKELVAGYWLIETKTKDEAIEWVKRAPFAEFSKQGGEVEIQVRQVYELGDLGEGEAIDRAREVEKRLGRER